jgi:isocitrate/isopropylmalate dehydrogenase
MADELNDEACRAAADRIKTAYNRALQEGRKTRDLGGDLGTEAFADALIERMG